MSNSFQNIRSTIMNREHATRIHQGVFDAIDTAERRRFWIIGAAAIFEGLGLVTYCLLADFSNRLHLLVFVAAMLVYCTIAIGLLALGAHSSVCTQRVLQAIEIASRQRTQDERLGQN
jgi:hypothetical protein